MKELSLSTLNPDVKSVEEYLAHLSEEEFETLLYAAESDLNDLTDDELGDLTALSVNIYSSEMEIDPFDVINSTEMVSTILKRFLSTVVLFSLMKKGFIQKTDQNLITLYKDASFLPTDKGKIIVENCFK